MGHGHPVTTKNDLVIIDHIMQRLYEKMFLIIWSIRLKTYGPGVVN